MKDRKNLKISLGWALIIILTVLNLPQLKAAEDQELIYYMVAPEKLGNLKGLDQSLVINAMKKDLATLSAVHRNVPKLYSDHVPSKKNLTQSYQRFYNYCQKELLRQSGELNVHKVCRHSLELAFAMNNSLIQASVKMDFADDTNFLRNSKERSTRAPLIWNYINWYKDPSRNNVGWKALEGYVCTESDPLILREHPNVNSKTLTTMPKMSPLILQNYIPYEDWTYVRYGQFVGYAHSSFLCMGNAREPVFSDEDLAKDLSNGDRNFYNYVSDSKCDHRNFSDQFIGANGGDRRLWLNTCFQADGTSKRFCMDMTCPNQSDRESKAFRKIYGNKVPHQLLPDSQQFGTGVELVKIAQRLEDAGLCIDRINNWHRPKKYNNNKVVGGKPRSMHAVEGGAKAIDILFCNHKDKNKAAKLMNQWHNGWFPGGMGVYKNSPTLHIDLRGYAARW